MSETLRNTTPNIRTFEGRRIGSATVFAILALGLANACSAHDDPASAATEGASHCQAEDFDSWTGTPTNVRVDQMAEALGVSVEKVKLGAMVSADCSQGLPVAAVGAGAVVTVDGIPNELRVSPQCVMFVSDVYPSAGAIAHHVRGICPAE